MASRISKQYNELFKYIGEKCGLRNLDYEDYQNLRENDVRKEKFDKFIQDNLPIEKAEDKEFANKIRVFNSNTMLRREDEIKDADSFYALGEKLYPKEDIKEQKDKPARDDKKSNSKVVNKSSAIKTIRGITRNIPSGALLASGISIAAFIGTRMLGSYAGWSAAAMIATANVTLLIPQAIILSYCGAKFISNRIKDGSIKRWFQKQKTKKQEKVTEKTNIKEKTKDAPLPEFDAKKDSIPTPTIFENPKIDGPLEVIKESLLPEVDGKKGDSPKTEEMKEAPLPEFDKSKAEPLEPIVNEEVKLREPVDEDLTQKVVEPIETDFVDNDENHEKDESENVEKSMRKPKHAIKNEMNKSEQELLESKIQLLEWKLEQLNAPTVLNESAEKTRYVENMKQQIKNELNQCKKQHKKFEERDLSTVLRSRKASLCKKLKNIEKNDTNKQLISNIEIAIEQIDNYLKLEELEKKGLISKQQLEQKASSAFVVSDYVLDESKKRGK